MKKYNRMPGYKNRTANVSFNALFINIHFDYLVTRFA